MDVGVQAGRDRSPILEPLPLLTPRVAAVVAAAAAEPAMFPTTGCGLVQVAAAAAAQEVGAERRIL